MFMVCLSAVRTFETPSPHSVNQFEPNVSQSENDDTRDRGCDCRIYVHNEDEIMNVDQFRKPLARDERDVDA